MLARLSLLLVALIGLGTPALGAAQGASENAEARVYFEEGNRLYQEASEADGSRRTTLLQRSLEAYVDSLQIVRSRNALFNAAIVLGELERYHASFNYFTEYLAVEGLTEADRADANRRRDELRERVAVLEVVSEPAGARVWVDRKDLAPRGETPIELAIPEGEHSLFFEREGFIAAELVRAAVRGETTRVEIALEPIPVPARVEPEPVPAPEAPRRLRNAAIGTAAGTLATAAAALGVSLRARTLRDDANQASAQYRMTGDDADLQRAQDLADRTDRFNVAADVLWGTTIALGVSAIVLYGVHRKRKKREAPEVAVSVSRRGGYASLKMAFGARQ